MSQVAELAVLGPGRLAARVRAGHIKAGKEIRKIFWRCPGMRRMSYRGSDGGRRALPRGNDPLWRAYSDQHYPHWEEDRTMTWTIITAVADCVIAVTGCAALIHHLRH